MFLLHIHSPTGSVLTVTFPSKLARQLVMIGLANQPVVVRAEDRAVARTDQAVAR